VSGEGGANEHILVVGFARDAVGHAEAFARVPRRRLATSLATTQDAGARVEHEAVWLHHAPPHTSSHCSDSPIYFTSIFCRFIERVDATASKYYNKRKGLSKRLTPAIRPTMSFLSSSSTAEFLIMQCLQTDVFLFRHVIFISPI